MRFLFYTHSLVSDWNHGNAHFLRGIMRDLVARGHEALALEPGDGWSRQNLMTERGPQALTDFATVFPELRARTYGIAFDHDAALAAADVVVVHEWTDPGLVSRIGRARRNGGRFVLLFHDTHHRAVSDGKAIGALALEDYDAVLAFGETLRERYRAAGWGRRVFTWHEAADDRLFRPLAAEKDADLVWIGNWGDDERSAEILDYLVSPAHALSLSADVHGVRYPSAALAALRRAGIRYRGWIANADVPACFARHRMTVHIPRAPYRRELPGIPTIRVFEALACGIPLISAPWEDSEGLFRPGTDYLVARDGREMRELMAALLRDPAWAAALSAAGIETIRARHTCRHRVDELLAILACSLGRPASSPKERAGSAEVLA
jgi:spore maturation protein CgeB